MWQESWGGGSSRLLPFNSRMNMVLVPSRGLGINDIMELIHRYNSGTPNCEILISFSCKLLRNYLSSLWRQFETTDRPQSTFVLIVRGGAQEWFRCVGKFYCLYFLIKNTNFLPSKGADDASKSSPSRGSNLKLAELTEFWTSSDCARIIRSSAPSHT